MRTFSCVYHRSLAIFIVCIVLCVCTPVVQADGGAPNLAYVSGASHGISVIDVAQRQVTRTIDTPGDPQMILLSLDGRFLYMTQPPLGRVAVLAARTGALVCMASLPGQPTVLALDSSANVLYAGGSGSGTVTAIDASTCKRQGVFQGDGNINGLALAFVGANLPEGRNTQLWVADATSLVVFDVSTGKQIGKVSVPDGPVSLSLPPGPTVYATTRKGSVVAVDLYSSHVTTLITGGRYGTMDYDAPTGEIYVADLQHQQLVVLSPVFPGVAMPSEPKRVIRVAGQPTAVAITSDGQLGCIALMNGMVAMLDVPARQIITIIPVGGTPHFIITGLYPPVIGTTPQQASLFTKIVNVLAIVFVVVLLVVPLLLARRYTRTRRPRT